MVTRAPAAEATGQHPVPAALPQEAHLPAQEPQDLVLSSPQAASAPQGAASQNEVDASFHFESQ